MRQQIKLTIILSIVLFVTVAVKLVHYSRLEGQTAYYFMSIFWICGVLIVIFLLNIVWHRYVGPRQRGPGRHAISWPNRRRTFRIIYPVFLRPTLYVTTSDQRARRNLEYPVIDLSQEGSCFIDDGSLGPMDEFSGSILLSSGKRLNVSGSCVRKTEDQVSVKFNRSLDWSTMLEEQRRVMSHMKPAK